MVEAVDEILATGTLSRLEELKASFAWCVSGERETGGAREGGGGGGGTVLSFVAFLSV